MSHLEIPGSHSLRIIHSAVWILVLILFSACFLSAQESDKSETGDTLVKKSPINQSMLRGFGTDILLRSSVRESQMYSPGFLHQSLTNLPTSLSSQFQQQIDIVSPWKQELAKQNELRTLKTILGAVQAGGTAYLLYEHIKKYGLK
jgi:hypothetical protein